MKRVSIVLPLCAVVTLVLLLIAAAPAWAAEQTFTGEVNDYYQLVADGQVFEIADTPTGNDLAENYISARVKVTGTVEERDDMKIITVLSYEVMSE